MQKISNIIVTVVVIALALLIVYYFLLRPRMQKAPMMPTPMETVDVTLEETMPAQG
jgi:hypothetical protein